MPADPGATVKKIAVRSNQPRAAGRCNGTPGVPRRALLRVAPRPSGSRRALHFRAKDLGNNPGAARRGNADSCPSLFENQGSFSLICKAGSDSVASPMLICSRPPPAGTIRILSWSFRRVGTATMIGPSSRRSSIRVPVSPDRTITACAADIVSFTAPRSGEVFSTGSIAFSRSLPHNNFDNNVSRLLANVVSAFIKR